jgi:hypothetical protein
MIMGTLECYEFGSNSSDPEYSLLIEDPSISCYEGRYKSWFAGAVALITLYVIPLPLFILFGLIVVKKRARGGLENEKVQGYLGSLYKGYKKRFYWWEFVMMSRRAIVVVFFTSFNGYVCLICFVVLC